MNEDSHCKLLYVAKYDSSGKFQSSKYIQWYEFKWWYTELIWSGTKVLCSCACAKLP